MTTTTEATSKFRVRVTSKTYDGWPLAATCGNDVRIDFIYGTTDHYVVSRGRREKTVQGWGVAKELAQEYHSES